MNIVHGNVNRYNFIIDRSREPGHAVMFGSSISSMGNHMRNQGRVKSSSHCCWSWQKLLGEVGRSEQLLVLKPLTAMPCLRTTIMEEGMTSP